MRFHKYNRGTLQPQEAPVSTKNISIYQIKITLKDIRPPIWRRVQVKSDISLFELHQIIQTAMGWHDAHLHTFIINGKFFGDPADDEFEEFGTIDEVDTPLRKVAPEEGFRFEYEYDFGDSWKHILLVEKILPVEADVRYPRCLKGKRACPPEDIGGVWGYESILEAIQDPDDPEFNDYVEWLGADFDPDEFDLVTVNQKLANLTAPEREKYAPPSSEALPHFDAESFAFFSASLEVLLNPEYNQTAEQLPLRKDFVAFLNYLAQNKVKGTQATGNLPRKAIQELAPLFASPVQLEYTYGDTVIRFQNEYEVEPIFFVHLLAVKTGMVAGGKSRLWTLTTGGVDFLDLTPMMQVWMMLSAWWLVMDWQAINDRYNFDDEMMEAFNGASFSLLLELPVDQSSYIATFAENIYNLAGLYYQSDQTDLVQMLKTGSVYSLLIRPLIQFGVLQPEDESGIIEYASHPERSAFRKTAFGHALLESVQNFVDAMPDAEEETPEQTEPQSFEEAFQDILQNIEFSIIQVYRADPTLTDYDVDRAIELLQRSYLGEAVGKTRTLPTNPLSLQVYESVRTICEIRLGRAALSAPDRKHGRVKIQPVSLDVIIDCLKRIRKSTQMWTKEGGRQGYLRYIDQFL